MNSYLNQTLSEIVVKEHRAARIFEKHNLDFCCKGKRSLSVACAEKNVPVNEILNELQTLNNEPVTTSFDSMSLTQLIGHILVHHHFYVKQSGPALREHLGKVAFKHGDKFPWMKQVSSVFDLLLDELLTHMHKEEMVLFPRIKALERRLIDHDTLTSNAIAVMESEHDDAGNYMQQLRELTNGFTWPDTACTTFRISMMELKEFEENLHEHVHLENNILFPKALKLSSEINDK